MNVDRALRDGLYVEGVGRGRILQRDNYTCYRCGQRHKGKNLTMDHVIPLAAGGPHCYANMAACCRPCNLKKADTVLPIHHPRMAEAIAAYELHHGHHFYTKEPIACSTPV